MSKYKNNLKNIDQAEILGKLPEKKKILRKLTEMKKILTK